MEKQSDVIRKKKSFFFFLRRGNLVIRVSQEGEALEEIQDRT